jgi:PAS domain S-box-containing protein
MMIANGLLKRSDFLFREHLRSLYASTDRLFGYLMICQYGSAIIWAYLASPLTWSGSKSTIHPHVITAVILGGLIAAPVCVLAHWKAGATITRYTIAVCQMLMSGLLIHVSGGRIETHFHIFGSLAFLAFYRDWKLLIPPTLVVLADHIVRGLYFPSSVYGVASGAEWRFLEHAAWVVFEDVILVAACLRGVKELRLIADRQAQLEFTNAEVEATVERRTSELQHTEQRKTAILNHALDGIITMDKDGLIVEFNPAAESMFGCLREDAIGKPLEELLGTKDFDPIFDCSEAEKANAMLNKRLQTTGIRDHQAFPIEVTVTSVQLEDGFMFTAFIRDLTDQKKLESDLAHAQKMESVGQLAAGVAHEINTPNQYIGDNIAFLQDSFGAMSQAITSLRKVNDAARTDPKFAELTAEADAQAQRSDLDFILAEVPHAVHQALEGVERVGSIVTAMKEFSHPGQELRTTVDVNRVIKSTVTVARNEWKYVAQVEFDLQADLPSIQGHPGELGQVFLNLLINSVHAIKDRFDSDPSGLIKISSKAMGESVEVTFSDNGGGIPEKAQGRIFEPFFTTKGLGLGTGQGLAISRAVVVQRHGGEISFDTTPGEGTTFRLVFPITTDESVAA